MNVCNADGVNQSSPTLAINRGSPVRQQPMAHTVICL
jgi:hypothetical protein